MRFIFQKDKDREQRRIETSKLWWIGYYKKNKEYLLEKRKQERIVEGLL